MNFVIFSYHFLPMAGAESYCTTRFASALAQAGHDVHVVTMDWPKSVSDKVYDTLVNPSIKITRVPLRKPVRAPIWSRMRYFTHEWESVNVLACIKVLKKVLQNIDSPILVSRTHPIVSLIVAWHCRKYAEKWIAHLSDPIPFYGGKLKRALMRLWCKRAFRDADGISVTCENAIRFYREFYGKSCDVSKMFVTPHIGDPWLASDERFSKPTEFPMIAHTGLFYAGRGAEPLLAAIKELNDGGCRCHFAQVGEVDSGIKDVFKGNPDVTQLENLSPSLSTAVMEAADALFVSDLQLPWTYIPYVPSKFAYQIFTDKPMVVFTKKDSMMGWCCRQYQSAGLFFADSDNPSSLVGAIRSAVDAVENKVEFDRAAIRKVFSPKEVSKNFIRSCGL